MTEFTPFSALFGGMLIGVAALILMGLNGRIAGISGILGGLLPPNTVKDKKWRFSFLAGLISAALLFAAFSRTDIIQNVSSNVILLCVAGVATGIGVALGAGCTSGHGVCGVSRFSKRSIAATVVFMLVAVLATFIMRHIVVG